MCSKPMRKYDNFPSILIVLINRIGGRTSSGQQNLMDVRDDKFKQSKRYTFTFGIDMEDLV